ncbi:hypothetical protein DMB42_46740 [Nonomuraea sp. WAC 01424]|uniref:hypothetical protein n=1 Tax=Nonomuraea sp. WAC 01424 TaxID=2203200 RepID=UPI000F77BDFD|nr:hypothetical protein [Nonomuraea sp. WAC 01424]RSM97069.1 hypothetical protein DMB42_46740 [Nonomuraea sp. WAC 01424]
MIDKGTAYSRAALARLAVTSEAADAARGYLALAADGDHSDHQPGDLVAAAHLLFEQARDILRDAVVCERLAGTSWETIGEAHGEISKQAAHERYGAADADFRRRALLAWLIPDRAHAYLGPLADPAQVLALLSLRLRPPQTGLRLAVHESEPVPPGYPAMTTTEQAGLIAEAANLLTKTGPHKGAELTPAEQRDAELGLAQRRVEMYEVLHAERPDDTDTADMLTGARTRLATLEDADPATHHKP